MPGSCGWFPLGPDEIRAWIERHRHELPNTLAEITRYPIPFRKAIVQAVAPEVRVQLWREHLTSFLSSDGELTAEEQALVRDAITVFPGIVSGPGGRAAAGAGARRPNARPAHSAAAFPDVWHTRPPEPPEGLPIPPDALPPNNRDDR